jgi:hypothetical protein
VNLPLADPLRALDMRHFQDQTLPLLGKLDPKLATGTPVAVNLSQRRVDTRPDLSVD